MNQFDDELVMAHTGWGAPVPLPVPTTTADLTLLTMEVRLCGWSLLETTGAASASALIRNGAGAANEIAAAVALAQGSSETIWLGDRGVRCDGGLFLDVLAGSLQGTLWVRLPAVT